MIKTILAIIGGLFVLLIAGSFIAGFVLMSSPADDITNNIIKENITIIYNGGEINPSEGYNLINSSEYGLCVEVPLSYYPITIFETGEEITINGEKYKILDYIELNTDGTTNDLVAVEPV